MSLFSRFILISATYALIMMVFFGGLITLGMADYPASPEDISAAFLATALLGFFVYDRAEKVYIARIAG